MTATGFAAAICAGLAVGIVAWHKARPLRPISGRLHPYTEVARSRLGLPPDIGAEPIFFGEATRRILGPLAGVIARNVTRLFLLADIDILDLRLRQAGHPMTVTAYRRRHIQWAIGVPALLVAVSIYRHAAPAVIILAAIVGAAAGLRYMPAVINMTTKRRCDRMRNDLYTVAQLLAVRVQAHSTLLTAIRELVEQGSGPIIDDLARAVKLINVGYGEEAAFALLDKESPEPAAGIFYRFLGRSTRASIDLPPALLQKATETRTQRRQEIERASIKRTLSMIVPNLLMMAPVLILFLIAPIPSLIFTK